jgi:hypothetical protein
MKNSVFNLGELVTRELTRHEKLRKELVQNLLDELKRNIGKNIVVSQFGTNFIGRLTKVKPVHPCFRGVELVVDVLYANGIPAKLQAKTTGTGRSDHDCQNRILFRRRQSPANIPNH